MDKTPEDNAVEDAAAQLLIELAFLVPIRTDLRKVIGPKLIAYRDAIEKRLETRLDREN